MATATVRISIDGMTDDELQNALDLWLHSCLADDLQDALLAEALERNPTSLPVNLTDVDWSIIIKSGTD